MASGDVPRAVIVRLCLVTWAGGAGTGCRGRMRLVPSVFAWCSSGMPA